MPENGSVVQLLQSELNPSDASVSGLPNQPKCRGFLVFAYGTLKRGFPNHSVMEGSLFIDVAQTKEPFALYSGKYPYAVRQPAVSRIAGEIYLVTAAKLAELDEFEGHPDLYHRSVTEVVTSAGTSLPAWLYFYPRAEGQLLSSGEYTIADLP